MNNTEDKNEEVFNWLQLFLIWCAGCDRQLLKSCDRTMHIKYRILGGLVLTPALFAFMSGSYFVHTIFQSYYIAIIIGLLWSLVVLNFDRYLIITLKKTQHPIKDLFSVSVMLRIILAGFMSYVVAQPLVLALFSPNIERQVWLDQQTDFNQLKSKYDQEIKTLSDSIEELNRTNAKMQSPELSASTMTDMETELLRQLTQAKIDLSTAQHELADEIAGKNGKKGDGPIARALRLRVTSLEQSITDLNGKLATERQNNQALRQAKFSSNQEQLSQTMAINTQQITTKDKELQGKIKERNEKLALLGTHDVMDFLTMTNKLDQLKEENANVRFWERLLTLLLFSIDLFALLLKVLGDPDEYDAKKKSISMIIDGQLIAERLAFEHLESSRLKYAEQKMANQARMASIQYRFDHELDKLAFVATGIEALNGKRGTFLKTVDKVAKDKSVNEHSLSEIILDYSRLNDIATKKLFEILESD